MRVQRPIKCCLLALAICMAPAQQALSNNPYQSISGVTRTVFTDSADIELSRFTGLKHPQKLHELYQNNSNQRLWDPILSSNENIENAFNSLDNLRYDGLLTDAYNIDYLRYLSLNSDSADSDKKNELDIYFTDAIITAALDLSGYRLPTGSLGETWFIENAPIDLQQQINTLILLGDVEEFFQSVRPNHPQYTLLREQFKKYNIMPAWPKIQKGPTLELGVKGQRVGQLIERLKAEKFLTIDWKNSKPFNKKYDKRIEAAVYQYQQQHNLEADGKVGRKSLKSLNTSAKEITNKIALNMERWRSAPNNFPNNHILVNTANYRMQLIEDNKLTMQMKVIVGKKSRQTPSFSHTMSYLEINPYWNIPTRITNEEVLPKLRDDREYAEKHGLRALQGSKLIPWSEVTDDEIAAQRFPYRLQQKPGKKNALGLYKFVFPNEHMVYLHDTPYKKAFSATKRSFSHGCVRLYDSARLAKHLLLQKGWSEKRISRTVKRGKRKAVTLQTSIPVYLMYLTNWVNKEGKLESYTDHYSQDIALKETISEHEHLAKTSSKLPPSTKIEVSKLIDKLF